MSLLDTLQDEMKVAMKARDKVRLSTLRMLVSDLKSATKEQGGQLNEGQELSIVTTHAKRRRESIDAFLKGGREDLADKERAELKIITHYLPEQLTSDEVEAMAREIIAAVSATSRRDMGNVMRQLMPRLKGRFPGKEVKPIIDRLLD